MKKKFEIQGLSERQVLKKLKTFKTKNSIPSSEFEVKDRCPSCGSYCNIHQDLDEKDNCNDCRETI